MHTAMYQLSQILVVVRNFAPNIYRSNDFVNMAQAERPGKFGLETLKHIFRTKYSPFTANGVQIE